MKNVACIIVGFWLLNVTVANAQEFDLFDKDRGKEKAAEQPKAPANPFAALQNKPKKPKKPPKPTRKPVQKDFALYGTSRIGSRYTVFLQAPDGKNITQTWKTGSSAPIKNNGDYRLLEVNPRTVKIAYPSSAPCNDNNPKKSVKCSGDGKFATVALMRANPTPDAPKAPAQNQQAQNNVINNPALQNAEALRQQREAELKRRQELYKNFSPNRIEDKDVPPGMRVIRTPFGDRLVPK